MSQQHPFEYGFILDNGTRIVHGAGSMIKNAFPPEMDIPGRLEVFSPGHRAEPSKVPCFCGPQGLLPFTTENRMPRHVHMAPAADGSKRYIVEKLHILEGIALAELGGRIYVIPPRTLVLVGPGVPHAWMACPPGLNLKKLNVVPEGEMQGGDDDYVSRGKFTAVYEYEEPTSFYPTAQTETLRSEDDYVACKDLQSIRFPKMEIEEVIRDAFFVWGRTIRKL